MLLPRCHVQLKLPRPRKRLHHAAAALALRFQAIRYPFCRMLKLLQLFFLRLLVSQEGLKMLQKLLPQSLFLSQAVAWMFLLVNRMGCQSLCLWMRQCLPVILSRALTSSIWTTVIFRRWIQLRERHSAISISLILQSQQVENIVAFLLFLLSM